MSVHRLMTYLDADDPAAALIELAGPLRSEVGLPPRVDEVGVVCPDVLKAANELQANYPSMRTFLLGEGSPSTFTEYGKPTNFTTRVGFATYRGLIVELAEPGIGSTIFSQTPNPDGDIVINHVGFVARGPSLRRKDDGRVRDWAKVMADAGYKERVEAVLGLIGLYGHIHIFETREKTADIEIEFLDFRLLSANGLQVPFPGLLAGMVGWILARCKNRFLQLPAKAQLPPELPDPRPSPQTHEQAIRALLAAPHDLDAAARVIENALRDPVGAHEAHGRIAPHSPPPPAKVTPVAKVSPSSLDALVEAVSNGVRQKTPLKAIGANNALSDATETAGVAIDCSFLNNVRKVTEAVYEFEAGATIDHINNVLEQDGKALYNQPGYGKLTYLGVASVGGHGSGHKLRPLSDYVRAIRVLARNDNGEIWKLQVQRSTGPALAVDNDFKVVQDDAWFRALSVGVGAIGTIYSVFVEVRSFYYLRETRVFLPWSELAPRLPELLADNSPLQSFVIWVNPYKTPSHPEVTCLLSTYDFASGPARGERGVGIIAGGSNLLSNIIVWWIEHEPKALPGLMDSAMRTTVDDDVVMKCYDALNFGSPNNLKVLASACGVPIERTADAVETVSEFAGRVAERGQYVTSPVGFRFTSATDALLSPQRDRATCMIEMPILGGTDDAGTTLDEFLGLMCDRYDARPHWGQRVFLKTETLLRVHPTLGEFREVVKALGGLGIYTNAFVERLGLR